MVEHPFKQISDDIQYIRAFLVPLEIRLINLDRQISASRMTFESKTTKLEAKLDAAFRRLAEHAARINEQSEDIFDLFDRVMLVELILKMPVKRGKPKRLPVREEKVTPLLSPTQKHPP